jgi:regulatory protein
VTDQASSERALEAALQALRRRDHSTSSLAERLERRGVEPDERAAAVMRLQELGYVDDARFAHARAEALAARGAGDLLIADDLERNGIARELVIDVIGGLEPERARAEAVVRQRGVSLRTARLLASRGFAEECVEAVVAAAADETIG